MANRPELTGHELREAINMATDDMGVVQQDIKRLARESRANVLEGDERKEFFRGMSQDEFEILHDLAFSMGPNGMNALERMLQEAQEVYREDQPGA